jgi:hypothetical protein
MTSRRNFLFGVVGFGLGGALATATGLGVYYYRRSRRQVPWIVRDSASLEEWVLTESDFNALAELDGVPGSEALQIMDNVDIPASGDFRAERVSSARECVAACEADEQCNAFTFARLSHPQEHKRHMCWLKENGKPDRLVDDVHYISGLRL